jgi:uncharacterized low-complexity protein
MKKIVIAAALAAFSTVAVAQSAEFYVDKKPATTTETTIVGDGKVFKTRAEAETGMKGIKVCTSN